jgi:uracil-DNA glycosylase family 4
MDDRMAALASLRARAEQLGAEVFGEGDPKARLMLVGEAPGEAEVKAGRPFVGAAGTVLNQMLDRLAIPRNKLWITNVVKIRPTAEGQRGEVNRAPTTSEVATYRSILDEEIAIVRPRVIVGLGAIAGSALIHPNFRVQSERGQWYPGPHGTRATATYHPAYLLRRRGPGYESARDEMLADLARAWGEANEE